MAELLGTAAAAMQIAGCCKSLLEALRAIRYASCTIRRYQCQLRDLESICCSIQRNSLLCTAEIEIQVTSIHSSITNYIDHKLGKSRIFYWPKYFIVRNEFAEFFRTLEEQKTSLTLSISNITASTVHDIRSDVQTMCKKNLLESTKNEEVKMKRFVSAPEYKALPRYELTLRSVPSHGNNMHSSISSLADSTYGSAILSWKEPETVSHSAVENHTTPQPGVKSNPTPQPEVADSEAETLYKSQEHTGQGEQVNGAEVNEKPGEALAKIMKDTKYLGNVKRASSSEGAGQVGPRDSQLNGPDFAKGALAEKSAGVYDKNRMEGRGPQINGPRIGQKKTD